MTNLNLKSILKQQIERPLGPTEDIYWRYSFLSPFNFGSVARFRGACDPLLVKRGLGALQMRHPLLQVSIQVDEDETPWYRLTDNPIELEVLEQPAGKEWQLLENSLITPFDTEAGPLARCVLVIHGADDFSLITTFHHAIADGRSATFLTRDLIQSMSQQLKGEGAMLEPMLPLEYYGSRINTLKTYQGSKAFFKMALKTLKASSRFVSRVGYPVGLKRSYPDQDLSEQHIQIESRSVSPESMRSIASRAKKEQVTLQCVLNAALCLAVASDSPSRGLTTTACSQVLDIRHRLVPPVGEEVGCFATGNTSLHRLNANSDFWDLARDISIGLKDSLQTPLPFFHAFSHKGFAYLGKKMGVKRAADFSRLIGGLHPEGLAVSNLGRVSFDVPDSAYKVTSFGFATNTTTLNYLNTSAATLDGTMIWNFSASSCISREKLARTADEAVNRMIKAANS